MKLWRLWGLVIAGLLIMTFLGGPPALASLNLLANGDFEGGFSPAPPALGVVANGWTPFVRATGQQPTFAEALDAHNHMQAISGNEPYNAGIFQRVTGLAVGQSYQAGVDAYPLPGQAGLSLVIGVDPLGGTDPFGSFVAWSNAGWTDTWLHLRITFVAYADAVTIFLRVNQEAGAGSPTIYFDNAYLRPLGSQTILFPLALKSHSFPVPTPTPTPTRESTWTPSPTLEPTPTATPTTPPASTVLWDPRLDDFYGLGSLHAEIIPCAGCRYKLTHVWLTRDGNWDDVPAWAKQFQNFPEAGGATHTFANVRRADGSPEVGKTVVLSWPSGSDWRQADERGWVNFFTNQPYYPDQGQRGPYCIQPLNGDMLCGGGLPYGIHVSLFGAWKEAPPGTTTPTALPTNTATATSTPTPTSAPTGSPTYIVTPTRTATPTPSPISTPTRTPSPTPTSSGTPAWQFQADGMIVGQPDCSRTSLGGTIRDESGLPLAGVRVKAWAPEWGQAISAPSDAAGHWEIHIADVPYRARWQLAIVNDAGQMISPIVGQMYTPDHQPAAGIPTSGDCVNGHQRLIINWKARSSWNDFVLASARFLSCEENHGNHNIYLWVVDRQGLGINGVYLRLFLPDGSYEDRPTGWDPYRPAGYLDFSMGPREERRVRVRDYTSDWAEGLSNTTPPISDACAGNSWGHLSYHVVFQASRPIALTKTWWPRPWLPFEE